VNRTKFAALGAATILAIGTIAMPLTALAAGSTITATPSVTTLNVGQTFTVTVKGNPSAQITTAQASLTFNNAVVQLTAVNGLTLPTGASYSSSPTLPYGASDLAAANAASKVSKVAWFDVTAQPAGTDVNIFSATFQAIAPGAANLGLPIGSTDAEMDNLDGDPLTDVTTSAGAVTVAVPATPTPTPVPTATPVPTPTPQVVGQGTTTVNGSIDAGFLGLTVPANVSIPLARNTTNNVNVPVTIFSNIAWNLQVSDPKSVNKGFMTTADTTPLVLANSMHVQQGTVTVCTPPTSTSCVSSPQYDVDLINGGLLATGASNASVLSTLAQFVAPQDKPGAYQIQILYSATSGF